MLNITPLITPTIASGVIASKIRSLCGWSFAEHTGTKRTKFVLRDGTGSSGPLVIVVTLGENESTRELLGSQGFPIRSGSLYLEMLEGSIEGQVTTV